MEAALPNLNSKFKFLVKRSSGPCAAFMRWSVAVCLCGQRWSVLREDRVKEAGGENWDLGSPTLDESLLTSLCLFAYLRDGETSYSYPVKSHMLL